MTYEEQLIELEFLESTYNEDELTILSRDEPVQMSFKLKGDPHDAENCHVGLHLNIELTEQYPEELPILNVSRIFGLATEDAETGFLEKLTETGQSVLGMQMIWQIVMDGQDWLEANNFPLKSMYEETKFAAKKREEEEENNRHQSESEESEEYRGLQDRNLVAADERATLSEFTAWAATFKKEMIGKGIWQDPTQTHGRLTGKMLFSLNKDKINQLEEGADIDGVFDEPAIDEGLFRDEELGDDLDDLDLDDIDLDD